jgi:hypothetical protein
MTGSDYSFDRRSMSLDVLDTPADAIQVLDSRARRVTGLIARNRIDLSNEKLAQSQIEQILTAAGMSFEREARLSAEDRPDFFMPDVGLAIEVKIKGARKMAVFHQLGRYAAHDRVLGLLLITSLAMGLPKDILGKPAYYASMGRAWL